MPIFDENGRALRVGQQIARGGEGVVYHLADMPDRCVKIYHDRPSESKQLKIRAMRQFGESLRSHAAFPEGLGYARPGDAEAHSVILPLVEGHDIYELYNPKARHEKFKGATFEFLVCAARNLAAAFENLHAHGVIVGDVSERNIKVRMSAVVSMIDCDSFQFAHQGHTFTSDVGTPLWTPPELQNIPLKGFVRTRNHDLFGLAQLIFLLLFAGRYPYAGCPLTNRMLAPEEAIREFAFAYDPLPKVHLLEPPPGAPPFESLPPALCLLFLRAFREDGTRPGGRPEASEWREALQTLAANLKRCAVASSHVYWSGARGCPWCGVSRKFGVDLFKGLPACVPGGATPGNKHLELATRLLRLFFAPAQLVAPSPQVLAVVTSQAAPVGRGMLASAMNFFGMRRSFAARKAVLMRRQLSHTEGHIRSLLSQAALLGKRCEEKSQPLLEKAKETATSLRDFQGMRKRVLATLQQSWREVELDKYLQKFAIGGASIRGIGDSRMATLMACGIKTAADVSKLRTQNVPGFGPAMLGRLLRWRRDCEAAFQFVPKGGPPAAIDARETELIRTELEKIEQSGASIEKKFAEIQRCYAQELGSIQKEYEDALKKAAVLKAQIDTLEGNRP